MFTRCCVLLGRKKKRSIPAYGVFMRQTKNDADLTACKTVAKRGKLLAKKFWALSKAERDALAKKGRR